MTDYGSAPDDAAEAHVEPTAYPPLSTVNLDREAMAVAEAYRNWVVAGVNDHCVRLAVMAGEYRWHRHPRSDECFLVLQGALEIDLADGRTIDLRPGELFTIPAGVRHRTRARVRSVNLCFEHVSAYMDAVFDDSPSRAGPA